MTKSKNKCYMEIVWVSLSMPIITVTMLLFERGGVPEFESLEFKPQHMFTHHAYVGQACAKHACLERDSKERQEVCKKEKVIMKEDGMYVAGERDEASRHAYVYMRYIQIEGRCVRHVVLWRQRRQDGGRRLHARPVRLPAFTALHPPPASAFRLRPAPDHLSSRGDRKKAAACHRGKIVASCHRKSSIKWQKKWHAGAAAKERVNEGTVKNDRVLERTQVTLHTR